jgi:hypothetical protein
LGVHQPGSTPGSSWRARWVIVVAVMVAPACRSSAERCCKFVAGSARPRRRVLPPLSPRSDDVQPRRSTHYGVVGGREEECEGGGAGGGGPVDYVVLEWRASSDASEARLAGRRDRVPVPATATGCAACAPMGSP